MVSALRDDEYKVTLVGTWRLSVSVCRYGLVLGHYRLVMLGTTWWYRFSRVLLCLYAPIGVQGALVPVYIEKKVDIWWNSLTDRWWSKLWWSSPSWWPCQWRSDWLLLVWTFLWSKWGRLVHRFALMSQKQYLANWWKSESGKKVYKGKILRINIITKLPSLTITGSFKMHNTLLYAAIFTPVTPKLFNS